MEGLVVLFLFYPSHYHCLLAATWSTVAGAPRLKKERVPLYLYSTPDLHGLFESERLAGCEGVPVGK